MPKFHLSGKIFLANISKNIFSILFPIYSLFNSSVIMTKQALSLSLFCLVCNCSNLTERSLQYIHQGQVQSGLSILSTVDSIFNWLQTFFVQSWASVVKMLEKNKILWFSKKKWRFWNFSKNFFFEKYNYKIFKDVSNCWDFHLKNSLDCSSFCLIFSYYKKVSKSWDFQEKLHFRQF